jgi:transposase
LAIRPSVIVPGI